MFLFDCSKIDPDRLEEAMEEEAGSIRRSYLFTDQFYESLLNLIQNCEDFLFELDRIQSLLENEPQWKDAQIDLNGHSMEISQVFEMMEDLICVIGEDLETIKRWLEVKAVILN